MLLNVCRHKGMQVCRAETGTASHFRCPYHAWTYGSDGRLVGVPFHEEAYGGAAGFDKAAHSLLSPPHVASYRGLVFANLDPEALPLEGALGDFVSFSTSTPPSDGASSCVVRRVAHACNCKTAPRTSPAPYHTRTPRGVVSSIVP